jgi:hypothetical protein
MDGDVVGRIAFDLILRLVFARANGIALKFYRQPDDFDDFSPHTTGFRVPTHVVPDFKSSFAPQRTHGHFLSRRIARHNRSQCAETERVCGCPYLAFSDRLGAVATAAVLILQAAIRGNMPPALAFSMYGAASCGALSRQRKFELLRRALFHFFFFA